MKSRVFATVTLAATFVMAGTAAAQGTAAPVINTPPGGVPEADQPLVYVEPKPLSLERLSIDGGAGILGYMSGAGAIGPAWNARASYLISPRIVLEANYNGAVNKRPIVNTTLVSTFIDADVRYNILRADSAPVQPYVLAGVGWGGFGGKGGDMGTLIIPVAVGAERALTSHIKIGARFTFRPAFFDELTYNAPGLVDTNEPGGDTYELVANVGGSF
jgi:hypothetical protein